MPPVGEALRILGIDPGSHVTGFGVIEREGSRIQHVAHGTLRPPRSEGLARRLAAIKAWLIDLEQSATSPKPPVEMPVQSREPVEASASESDWEVMF